MNAFFFFYGYVNSKTTLKQFVEQYDNALWDKFEKESLENFNSLNSIIPCVSHFGFKYQFQKVYSNANFKEFQEELASIMYYSTHFEKFDGSILMYLMIESKKVCDIIKYVSFNVCFNEENFDLHCTCLLFEFEGILCRHILSLLKLIRKTELVPS